MVLRCLKNPHSEETIEQNIQTKKFYCLGPSRGVYNLKDSEIPTFWQQVDS